MNNKSGSRASTILKIFLVVVLFSPCLFAQWSEEEHQAANRSEFHTPNPFSFEVFTYLSNDTSTIELLILYRLHQRFFFFVKNGDAQQDYYEAKGELGVEILDEKEVAVARDFRQIHLERNSIPEENNSNDREGSFTFKLKRGNYRIVFEAKDYSSERSFTNRDININTQASHSYFNISTPVFVNPINQDSLTSDQKKYFAINNGGNVIIGRRGGCLYQIVSPDTISNINLSWEIQSRIVAEGMDTLKFRGSLFYGEAGTPAIVNNKEHVIFTVIKDSKKSRVVFIPLPTERLEAGNYKIAITVIQDTNKSTKEASFSVIWPNKPQSLSSLNIAIDALRHIATEKEIDQISSFSVSKSTAAFREFWKKQNPDTLSAYNPRMAEYYRRVDEAIKRYSTGDEIDGYKTDRGRIFILFGSPSILNRLLKPDSPPTEIWTYEKLKQRFIFVDRQKNGNYILEKEEKY